MPWAESSKFNHTCSLASLMTLKFVSSYLKLRCYLYSIVKRDPFGVWIMGTECVLRGMEISRI